jgi:hypothetical protein
MPKRFIGVSSEDEIQGKLSGLLIEALYIDKVP